MHEHEKRFHHHHAHRLDDPERAKWLPVEPVLERLGVRPGLRVIDVGAGTGYFALPMARAVGAEGRVTAVDAQPEMLTILRARIGELPVDLVSADAARTGLSASSADLVFYANVWHEVDDRRASLAEADRLLRAGGKLAILDWRTDVSAEPGPRMEHRIPMTEAVAELKGAGWEVDDSGPLGPYHYLLVARPGGPLEERPGA